MNLKKTPEQEIKSQILNFEKYQNKICSGSQNPITGFLFNQKFYVKFSGIWIFSSRIWQASVRGFSKWVSSPRPQLFWAICFNLQKWVYIQNHKSEICLNLNIFYLNKCLSDRKWRFRISTLGMGSYPNTPYDFTPLVNTLSKPNFGHFKKNW